MNEDQMVSSSRLRKALVLTSRLALVLFFLLLELVCIRERVWVSAGLFAAALTFVAIPRTAWPALTFSARVWGCVITFVLGIAMLPDSFIK